MAQSAATRLKQPSFSKPILIIFCLVFASIGGYAIYRSFAANTSNPPGDTNNDGVVNLSDLNNLLANWNTNNIPCDFNNDGIVNGLDLSILLAHYGQSVSVTLPDSTIYKQPDGSDISQTGTGSSAIQADVGSAATGRIFNAGQTVPVTFTTNASSADTLNYEIDNYQDKVVTSGSFAVPSGSFSKQITWMPTQSGYFAIKAILQNSKQFLPQVGSRPQGISTFGVLPNTSSWTGYTQPTLTAIDQYRWGVQGTATLANNDPYQPLYSELGTKWVLDSTYWWSSKEPTSTTNWQPITNPALIQPTTESQDGLVPIYTFLQNPAWASPTGQINDNQYLPTNMSAYQTYMQKVGEEVAATRTALYPTMTHDYFQIIWEPDNIGGITEWLGTDAQFAQLYQAAYTGLHAGDPKAVVLGPTYGSIACTIQTGSSISGCGGVTKLSTIGATSYMDGLSAHGYWYNATGWTPPEAWPNGTGLTNPPIPLAMRTLRSQMAQYLGSGAQHIYQTEAGVRYQQTYAKNFPALSDMQMQAAYLLRGNLEQLGEGADFVTPFYSADYSGEDGYGMDFNLIMPNPDFGTSQISPKISSMALATATRLTGGTFTLGYFNNLTFDGTTPGVVGYAFQSRSSNQVTSVLWAWGGATKCSSCSNWTAPFNGSGSYNLQVGASGTSGNVTVIDFMGNASLVAYTNGIATINNLSEYPTYVISNDPTSIKTHITAPQGYTP